MTTYTKYVSTNGHNVDLKEFDKRKLAKVFFGKLENGSWEAWVESAHNGSMIKKCGKLTLTQEQMSELPADPHNSTVFDRAAFALFGASL